MPPSTATPRTPRASTSELHYDLARRIAASIRDQGLEPGEHLTEYRLTQALGVSRTPVRAALRVLAELGVLEARVNQGFFVSTAGRDIDPETLGLPVARNDALYDTILRDRACNALPEEVHESLLQQRYDAGKGVITKALLRIAEEGLIQRQPGRGWRFAPALSTAEARDDSYRFRIMVECNALLEPGFRLLPRRFGAVRRAHEALLARIDTVTPPQFYEINAAFHEMLAEASGNRFVLQAVQAQNRIRKLSEYSDFAYLPHAQVTSSCHEHLAILDAVEARDARRAARLMRKHLTEAKNLKMEAAEAS